MFAGLECSDGQLVVRVCWSTKVNEVDLWIGNEVRKVPVGFHLGHVELEWLIVADIAEDFGKVAVQITSAGIAQRRDVRIGQLSISLQMGCGHEAETDDADVDGRHGSDGS